MPSVVTSHLNTDGTVPVPEQYEWCADTGTNRFVTNDINDYVPGSIRHDSEAVSVGGGVVTSPCVGTVRIRSLDYNHIVECNNVLYLPSCAKKLMPAYQFLDKDCEMLLRKGEVHLKDKGGSNIFSGKEIGGLYYYRSQTVHSNSLRNSQKRFCQRVTLASLWENTSPRNRKTSENSYSKRIGHMATLTSTNSGKCSD